MGAMHDARCLTGPERELVASMFGTALDTDTVTVRRRRWWPLQPRGVVMAPMGHLHFHPDNPGYRSCFGCSDLRHQAFFLHEMTHVWQSQTRGRWYLPLMRHPFCRYGYDVVPGRRFEQYGLEQQAEIVRHVHLLRHGVAVADKPSLAVLQALLPFAPA